MSLSGLIEGVEEQRSQAHLVVFNHSGPSRQLEAIRQHFRRRGVSVEHRETDRSPENFVVLYDGPRSVAADSAEAVYADVSRPTELPDPALSVPTDQSDLQLRSRVSQVALTTACTSRSRAELTRASRAIEHHAARHGGELHSVFQTLSNARQEWDRYRQLPAAGVDVHVYGVPDWRPPGLDGELRAGRTARAAAADGTITVHTATDEEIRRSWVVAYRGAGDPAALVAQQRSRDRYFGFWTSDSSRVDHVFETLRSRAARSSG